MNAIGKWLAGAKAAEPHDNTVVLWVFRNYESRWCVRIEGDNGVKEYRSRDDALAAARLYGAAWGSYRLYLQMKDGRVMTELFNLRDEARSNDANVVLPFLRTVSRPSA